VSVPIFEHVPDHTSNSDDANAINTKRLNQLVASSPCVSGPTEITLEVGDGIIALGFADHQKF
jgi:hypothetical protein